MKETDKGTVKEAVFMAARLAHRSPIKTNGLGDCTVTGGAGEHTGGTALCLYMCVNMRMREKKCVRMCVTFYLPT